MSQEYTGEQLGAGVSIIVVDTPPGRGPSPHRHRYEKVVSPRFVTEWP